MIRLYGPEAPVIFNELPELKIVQDFLLSPVTRTDPSIKNQDIYPEFAERFRFDTKVDADLGERTTAELDWKPEKTFSIQAHEAHIVIKAAQVVVNEKAKVPKLFNKITRRKKAASYILDSLPKL